MSGRVAVASGFERAVWESWMLRARRDFGLPCPTTAAFWKYLAHERGARLGYPLAERAPTWYGNGPINALVSAIQRVNWPPDQRDWWTP